MKDFVLDRSRWYRGQDNGARLLRAKDGMMCCLGLYLESCGVPHEELLEREYPSRVSGFIPEEAMWTVLSSDDLKVAWTNDDSALSDDDREPKLVELFARHGVNLTFVDGPVTA